MLLTLALIIGIPFLIGGLALLVRRPYNGWLALLAPASVIALGLPLWLEVGGGGEILVPLSWFPDLNLTADLFVNRLGAFFVLLIGIIGLGIVQYSRYYLKEAATGWFWFLLLSFMGSMLGIVLSDSLLLLFVFWELTTITSFLLIGIDFGKEEGRRGALQAFLVTGAGGLALLVGVVLLGQMAGTYNLSELAGMADQIVADPRHTIPLILIFIGAFTKSAQFPFHFWLPGAMAAPAPISAYLHSATMVKAGVFLLGRMFPIFSEAAIWLPTLATIGLITFLVAGWNAVRSSDLKQLLAHSTVAYLGVLTALYGFYARVGLAGELTNILNHALYKSSLFLLIGWMEKAMGSRDLAVLQPERWLGREKWGATLIGIGAFAMIGMPFLLGFMAKDTFFYAVADGPIEGFTLALVITVVASILAVTYALKLWAGVFFGSEEPPTDRGYPRKKISVWLLIVPAILLVPQVVGGVVPAWYLGRVVEPGTTWQGVAFWQYLDVKLVITLAMLVAGFFGYRHWRRLAAIPVLPGPQRAGESLVGGTLAHASWLSRNLQLGGHARYASAILLVTIAAIVGGIAISGRALFGEGLIWGPNPEFAWLPAVVVGVAAVLTVTLKRRIPKAVMMAIVGYGMAVFYVFFRAPDLALTQLLVETVSVILLLLIFRRMPELGPDVRSMPRKLVHGGVAVATGVTLAAVAWAAGSYHVAERAGYDQLQLALPIAEGRNVVNVILVDFRGMDTLGEIAVLAIATFGAYALFRGRRRRPAGPEAAEVKR
jgi:multicomponent K+:H+ antiporter subunit A